MRVFRCLCKDSKTNLEMVLSEASFNNACSYINDTLGLPITSAKTNSKTNLADIFVKNKLMYHYDETRGYLLRAAG